MENATAVTARLNCLDWEGVLPNDIIILLEEQYVHGKVVHFHSRMPLFCNDVDYDYFTLIQSGTRSSSS